MEDLSCIECQPDDTLELRPLNGTFITKEPAGDDKLTLKVDSGDSMARR